LLHDRNYSRLSIGTAVSRSCSDMGIDSSRVINFQPHMFMDKTGETPCDLRSLARLSRRLPVCYRHFDLSKQGHYLLRLVPLTSCHLALLVPVCLLVTGTNQPGHSAQLGMTATFYCSVEEPLLRQS
jgi:hypothetical protein